MLEGLKALYDAVVATGKAVATSGLPSTVDANGRVYIRTMNHGDVSWDEVREFIPDNSPYLRNVDVVDVESLIGWALAAGADDDGEIHLSRTDRSLAMTPRRLVRSEGRSNRNQAAKPFFDRYLPPSGWLDYIRFRRWVDSLADGLEKAEQIQAQMQAVSVVASEGVKIEQSAAAVVFRADAKKEIKSALPRMIAAEIPFGDPAFATRVEFLITVKVSHNKVPEFLVELRAPDKAYDAYVAWAKEAIEASALGWPVFVTQ